MYQDKTLKCRDCGAEFVFTASEQAFFAEKGFQNEPGRCRLAVRRVVRPMAAETVARPSDVRRDLRWLRPAHSGAVPAPRRSSGLLPRLLRGPAPEPLLILNPLQSVPGRDSGDVFCLGKPAGATSTARRRARIERCAGANAP